MSDHAHDAPRSFWTRYVFSTDHKVIGLQFTFTALLFVIIGGLLALGVRSELAWPQQNTVHDRLLPGGFIPEGTGGPRMTSEAPEPNPAMWKVGGEVTIPRLMRLNVPTPDVAERTIEPITPVEAAEDDDVQEIEAQPSATLEGFVDGMIAVQIPAGTRVPAARGEPWTVRDAVDAKVRIADVMADDRYKLPRAQVRALPGTHAVEATGPDGTGRDLVLIGRTVHRPSPPGERHGTSRPELLADEPVYLPIVPQETWVSFDMPR